MKGGRIEEVKVMKHLRTIFNVNMQWMVELGLNAEPFGTEVVGRRLEGAKQDHKVGSV